jgi:hypothetical protein
MKLFLGQRLQMLLIHELPLEVQVELMKWVFRNEDKVWRDRGGRPYDETLQMFLNLVAPSARGILSTLK